MWNDSFWIWFSCLRLYILEEYKGDILDSCLQTLKYLQYEFFATSAHSISGVLPVRMEFRPMVEMTPEHLEAQVEMALQEAEENPDEDVVTDFSARLIEKLAKDNKNKPGEGLDSAAGEGPAVPVDPLSLSSLLSQGFEEGPARQALRKFKNDTQAALDFLIGGGHAEEEQEEAVRMPTTVRRVQRLKERRRAQQARRKEEEERRQKERAPKEETSPAPESPKKSEPKPEPKPAVDLLDFEEKAREQDCSILRSFRRRFVRFDGITGRWWWCFGKQRWRLVGPCRLWWAAATHRFLQADWDFATSRADYLGPFEVWEGAYWSRWLWLSLSSITRSAVTFRVSPKHTCDKFAF